MRYGKPDQLPILRISAQKRLITRRSMVQIHPPLPIQIKDLRSPVSLFLRAASRIFLTDLREFSAIIKHLAEKVCL